MRDSVVRPPALLVKIAPDLAEEDEADIAALAAETALQGLVISNTTVARPASLASAYRGEAGGLSGAPLFVPSTAQLARMYKATGGRIPLVGVGGIASGKDAYAKIRAGASLVQLYSALALQGPALLTRIKQDLARLLRADGFGSVAEAVGADHA
jgi:dihydroorotate dehydrogenase